MNTEKTFDERQIIERGKVFQAGFFAAILLSLVVFFATSVFDIKIAPLTVFTIQTFLPILICMMALILKSAFDPVKKRGAAILSGLFFVIGLYLIIFSVGRVYLGQSTFVRDGVITDSVGFLLAGIGMVDTGIVYLIRRNKDQKELTEE